MVTSAASAYQDSRIITANPQELTLMLYEGAIKFCNIALMNMEKQNVAKVHENIVKAENIILELKRTLDFKYTVAKSFEEIYDYIYNALVDANLRKDPERLEEALGYLREMRDTWKEVMKVAKSS